MTLSIDRDELLSFLRMDIETGQFFWIKQKSRALAGAEAGTVRKNGYRSLELNGKRMLCHRLVWLVVHGRMPLNVIDHIDGNKLNNRPENLRDVPERVNFHNQVRMRESNTSGYKGVTWDKSRGNFKAQIMVNRKRIHLGAFGDPAEAHQAYLKAKDTILKGVTL